MMGHLRKAGSLLISCTTNEDISFSGLFTCKMAMTRSAPSLPVALTLSEISAPL